MNTTVNVLSNVANWLLDQYSWGLATSSNDDPDDQKNSTVKTDFSVPNNNQSAVKVDDVDDLTLSALLDHDWVWINESDFAMPIDSYKNQSMSRCSSQTEWFITPPSCFTCADIPDCFHPSSPPIIQQGPAYVFKSPRLSRTQKIACNNNNDVSIFETLLIENPSSMSIYEKFPDRFGHIMIQKAISKSPSQLLKMSLTKTNSNDHDNIMIGQKENDFFPEQYFVKNGKDVAKLGPVHNGCDFPYLNGGKLTKNNTEKPVNFLRGSRTTMLSRKTFDKNRYALKNAYNLLL